VRFRSQRGAVRGADDAEALPSVHVNEVAPFHRPAPQVRALGWHVEIEGREQVDALAKLVDRSPGEVPIVVHVGGRAQRMRGGIAATPFVQRELEVIFKRVWQEPA